MSARGYLWQGLSEEIAKEFAHLTEPSQPSLAVDVRSAVHVSMSEARRTRRDIPEQWRRALRVSVARENAKAPATEAARTRRQEEKHARLIEHTQQNEMQRQARERNARFTSLTPTQQLLVERAEARAAMRRRGMREKLPDERAPGVTHHFAVTVKCNRCEQRGAVKSDCRRCNGQAVYIIDGYLRTGCYGDGRVGEIFLTLGKVGDKYATYDTICKLFSVALQYGAPFVDICRALIGVRNVVCGATSNKNIPRCASIEDYVGRYLLRKYEPALYHKLYESDKEAAEKILATEVQP